MANMINSNRIDVFPSVRRGVTQPSARLMSEQAFTSIVNRFVEYDSFIINYDKTTEGKINFQGPISFNIHGYYFKAAVANDLLSGKESATGDTLYAFIEVIKVGDYYEIWGQDDEDVYQGLKLTFDKAEIEPEHGGEVYFIPLFQRSTDASTDWDIVIKSLFRFTLNTVEFKIDGKEF